jgi:glycine cleavage system H protein
MSIRYTKDHEWVRLENGVAVVGISEYAAEQLGDVVYVELPAIGKSVTQGGEMAVVESAKAASDVYAPIAGSIAEVNDTLGASPNLVNESAEKDGWFVKITPSNAGEIESLMDAAAYKVYVGGLD